MEGPPCIICAMRGTPREGKAHTSCVGNYRTKMVLCDEHQYHRVEVRHLDPQRPTMRRVLDMGCGLVCTECFYNTETLEVRCVYTHFTTKDAMTWDPRVGWSGGHLGDLTAPDIGPMHAMLVEHYKSPGKNVFEFE
jgi:hypothetical protein